MVQFQNSIKSSGLLIEATIKQTNKQKKHRCAGAQNKDCHWGLPNMFVHTAFSYEDFIMYQFEFMHIKCSWVSNISRTAFFLWIFFFLAFMVDFFLNKESSTGLPRWMDRAAFPQAWGKSYKLLRRNRNRDRRNRIHRAVPASCIPVWKQVLAQEPSKESQQQSISPSCEHMGERGRNQKEKRSSEEIKILCVL